MKTRQLYYEDNYRTEMETSVLEITESAGSLINNIILEQTVFFPEGGGQPGDRGEIVGPNGSVKIEYMRTLNGEVVHQGKVTGSLIPGDKVTGKIDWEWRYKYMKIHTTGHLVHDVFMTLISGLTPIKGSHGSKAFLEYQGSVDTNLKGELEKKVNEVLNQDLPIMTKEASYDELVAECQFVPPNLPRERKLRLIKIGSYPAMPDGGVHVKSTKEIGQIMITDLISENGVVTVKYRVPEP